MEEAALEVQRLAGNASSLFTSAKSSKVLSSLGDSVVEKLEGHATCGLALDSNVEENLCVLAGHDVKVWVRFQPKDNTTNVILKI